ncbi:IS3 family transposase [Clostridioides sp. ZZV14-6345]|nr:IS3 family transposase [Clostridioides sp. ZZV14-6345]
MYYLRKFDTYEQLIKAIENYIYYYNNFRYQKKLNSMSPLEFRLYHKLKILKQNFVNTCLIIILIIWKKLDLIV